MAFKLKTGRGSSTLPPIKKFTTVGESVEGIYRGTALGKYGPLLHIGEIAVPRKKVLEDYFQDMPIGALVRVTFKGKVDIKGGKTLNTFEVEVDEEGESLGAPAESYADLAAKLAATPGGGALRKAVEDMFADPAARLEKIKAALRERGATV